MSGLLSQGLEPIVSADCSSSPYLSLSALSLRLEVDVLEKTLPPGQGCVLSRWNEDAVTLEWYSVMVSQVSHLSPL